MAKQVFSLRNVFADEAEDVRGLLYTHDIEFYETTAGNWGVSVAAIWLHNDSDFEQARDLIADYQRNRASGLGVPSKASRRQILLNTFRDMLDQPLRFLLMLLLAAGILTISVKPFFF